MTEEELLTKAVTWVWGEYANELDEIRSVSRKSLLELVKFVKDEVTIPEESVSEDLGEYINELSKQFPEVSFAKLSRISVRVAKWQIAKLMKDATEVTVHIDASNYPYIPQIELYDYDKDVPLAKEGDKYKVILIKENKDE